MAQLDLNAAFKTFVRDLAQTTGRAEHEFLDEGQRYAPLAAGLAAEGATEDDYAELAESLYGILCTKGINIQAGAERGAKAVLQVLLTAGRAALGV